MRKATKIYIFIFALILQGFVAEAYASTVYSSKKDSITVYQSGKEKKKKTFFQHLMAPLKWVGKNWSAYDPRYSTPSFYNWAGQFQNTFSQEFTYFSYGNFELAMKSKLSSKIGPYFGYNWLFYGWSLDLNALKGTKRRTEFTISINSALVNADIIWRRTGGDYRVTDMMFPDYSAGMTDEDPTTDRNTWYYTDMTDYANKRNFGNYFRNDLTGINLNFFINHKKYSNPAAFSNGAIQLRSVGSPIVGMGYTVQKFSTQVSDLLFESAVDQMLVSEDDKRLMSQYKEDGNEEAYIGMLDKVIYQNKDLFADDNNVNVLMYTWNDVPSTILCKDLHLQLGYAYNIVFSRRLLFGASLILGPSVKWIKFNNYDTYEYKLKGALSDVVMGQNGDVDGIEDYQKAFVINGGQTRFNVNAYLRASLVYNLNRWRFGINFNGSVYYHGKDSEMCVENSYFNSCAYVGYCFGRKKEYRWNGANREAYVKAALTKYQIQEVKDTFPESNLDKGQTYEKDWGQTKYHKDVFDFDFCDCDLVQGPDGSYGSFTVKDGRVTHGNDTEGRIRPGLVYFMDKEGHLQIEAGHNLGIRTANWLKSKLTVRQMPTNWYPEFLQYSLCGTLTFYVRDKSFGSKAPVKVTIDDFYLSHGKESKDWCFIGAKSFFSHSSFSIIGTADINDRLCRVYIESRKHGARNYVYIDPLRVSSLSWMRFVPNARPISNLSIPGTHDAGSASLPESAITSMGHTQNFTVSEQLSDGIRAFDIRLKKNMKYGHSTMCRDGFDESLEDISSFLKHYPSEFIICLIGSDEGGKWSDEMKANFKKLIDKYPDLFVENFNPYDPIEKVRGKILVIKRQADCPFGKLLEFEDNAIFKYDCFHVEDCYKMHKTYKKYKVVANFLREAYENEDPNEWYITFNSIAWDPRHHKPYYSAWGNAFNVRKPMNKALRETFEQKGYSDFGIVFLDFYNDHGDKPELVQYIIKSNYHLTEDDDYIPASSFKVHENE